MGEEQGNVVGLAAAPVDLAAQLDEFCKTLKSMHTTISKRIEADNYVAGLWNQVR